MTPRARLLALLVALSALVGGEVRAEVVENERYTGEKTLIRWAFWGGEETVSLFREIGQRFVEAHPEIAVDITIYPWGQYWQKLQTQTASGLAPDVLSIYTGQAGIWINHGALRPLDDLARGVDRGAFYPGAIQNFEWDGTLYALPIEMAVYTMVYSVDRLEERGIPPSEWPHETEPMSWQAFKDLMGRLTLRDSRGALIQYGMGNSFLASNSVLVPMYGGDFLDRRINPTRPTVRGNDALRRGLVETWTTQYADRLLVPTSVFKTAGIGGDDVLQSPTVASAYLGPWVLKGLHEQGLRYRTAPIPKGSDPIQTMTVNGVGIYKDSEHPAEAWTFIQFLAGPVAQGLIASELRGVPALRAAAPSLVDNRYGVPGLEAYLVGLDDAQPVRTASNTYIEKAVGIWQERVDTILDQEHERRLRRLQAQGDGTVSAQALQDYRDGMAAFVEQTVDAQLPLLAADLDGAFARASRPQAGVGQRVVVPLVIVLLALAGLGAYLLYVRRQETTELTDGTGRHSPVAAYLCLSPWLVGFAFFTVGPILASVVLSFTEWNMITAPRWVGAQHYGDLFADRYFGLGIQKTFGYAALVIPISTIGGIATAGLLTSSVRGADSFKAIFYFPSLFTGAAAAVLWVNMFHKEYGIVNRFVEALGGLPINWLDEAHAFYTVVLMNVFWIGGATIIYYAGMKQIPRSLYEAAEIDGASALRRFWSITLPLLSPVILFMVVMTTIGAFQVFTPALFFVNYPSEIGGPGDSLRFYAVNIYDEAFNNLHMGKACAWAFVLFLIIFAVTMVQLKVSKRFVYSEAEG
ncbi:extracellular solute-binding protein [Rubrivirga sp.]|uniref:extracellular solute-binding protein n=1 Tax=Rubrivirga sp. TaxID=1885344 RepID=UPI003B519F1C